MPATFHLFSFPPLAGGTTPALIKWMRWTGVETDPEVQGVWAGPNMARLAPPDTRSFGIVAFILQLQYAFIFYCSICIYNRNGTMVAMPHSPWILTAASSLYVNHCILVTLVKPYHLHCLSIQLVILK